MVPRYALALVVAIPLAACGSQTDRLEALVGLKGPVVLDPAAVDKVRADVAANGFTEAEVDQLVGPLLTKAVEEPGDHPLVPLVSPEDNNLYVGASSTRTADRAVDADFIVKDPLHGTLHVHAVWSDQGDAWAPRPGSYRVTHEPASGEKKAKGRAVK